jgi:hypothetical protein
MFIREYNRTDAPFKDYSYEDGLRRIKSLLVEQHEQCGADASILGDRPVSTIDNNDLLDIGYQHFDMFLLKDYDYSLRDEIEDNFYDEVLMFADGFDEAIVGVCSSSYRVIYSVEEMIRILMDEGMEYIDAIEHLSFNVVNAYVGDRTPIYSTISTI